jgi:hypothetical protein
LLYRRAPKVGEPKVGDGNVEKLTPSASAAAFRTA